MAVPHRVMIRPRIAYAVVFGLATAGSGHGQDVDAARAKELRVHAQALEGALQPLLRAELELARRTCGTLPADARRGVVATGSAALAPLATRCIERRLGIGEQRQLDRRIDLQQSIHEAVAAAVRPVAAPDEFAAYEREHAARQARRARAARVQILAKLDQFLDLAATQREAIEADLTRQWEPAWLRELDDSNGTVVNTFRPAPDFAAPCIEPHLNGVQRAIWREWCEKAPSRIMQRNVARVPDTTSLPPDPWWTP